MIRCERIGKASQNTHALAKLSRSSAPEIFQTQSTEINAGPQDQVCRLAARQKTLFFVGDEVTSLKFLGFLQYKLETPHVVSYFLNGLLATGQLLQLFRIPGTMHRDLRGGAFNLTKIVRRQFDGNCSHVLVQTIQLRGAWDGNNPRLLCQ